MKSGLQSSSVSGFFPSQSTTFFDLWNCSNQLVEEEEKLTNEGLPACSRCGFLSSHTSIFLKPFCPVILHLSNTTRAGMQQSVLQNIIQPSFHTCRYPSIAASFSFCLFGCVCFYSPVLELDLGLHIQLPPSWVFFNDLELEPGHSNSPWKPIWKC